MPSRPRPFAHRLAAFGLAGLFSLGVLGATFRDTTRSVLHSAALPMFARMSTGEPGADWTGADAEVQYAAERAHAAADLARARAETERARADLARLAARETRERVRVAEAKHSGEAAATAARSADAWAAPATFTFVSPEAPAAVRVRERTEEALGRSERITSQVTLATAATPGGCVHGLQSVALLDAQQRGLAALADLPRRLQETGGADSVTPQQADSIAKFVVAHLDTTALRAVRTKVARLACG